MRTHGAFTLSILLSLTLVGGCASSRTDRIASQLESAPTAGPATRKLHPEGLTAAADESVRQVVFQETPEPTREPSDSVREEKPSLLAGTSLIELEQIAIEQNPRLTRLEQEYQAAAARSHYVDKLPDPKLGANVFGDPIETASGSQRANMNLSQTVPWLGKLSAQQQQASLEAFAIRAERDAERLNVLAAVRTGWYRLYVIDKQIETAIGNQKLLKSLIDVANARIATGKASQGDVLLGTLELSQLEERLLTFRKQRRAVEAEMNRWLARPAATPIPSPTAIQVGLPQLTAAEIYQIARNSQPEIEAAQLRAQATRMGIEVARLSRRPDVTFSASYFFTDNNRPQSNVVNVGEDPWAIGAQVSIPIGKQKYDAMDNEAGWKHQAAFSTVDELFDRYDAQILDLFTEIRRAADTATLYESTILPQARQTLSADQGSYAKGTVEFDRVIRDYRNLLTLELGYHVALGDLAIAIARIRQAAGRDIAITPRQPRQQPDSP